MPKMPLFSRLVQGNNIPYPPLNFHFGRTDLKSGRTDIGRTGGYRAKRPATQEAEHAAATVFLVGHSHCGKKVGFFCIKFSWF